MVPQKSPCSQVSPNFRCPAQACCLEAVAPHRTAFSHAKLSIRTFEVSQQQILRTNKSLTSSCPVARVATSTSRLAQRRAFHGILRWGVLLPVSDRCCSQKNATVGAFVFANVLPQAGDAYIFMSGKNLMCSGYS